MSKKITSSPPEKSKDEAPTIRSSISSQASQQKKPLPASERDVKTGGAGAPGTPSSPAGSSTSPATRPPGAAATVPAAAAAGAAATSTAAEHESRMATLRSRWDSVSGRATLASLYGGLDAMTQQLQELQSVLANLRARGYRYGRGWEGQLTTLQEAWPRQREEATRILEEERRNLDSAKYDVQTLLNRAAREPALFNTADSRVRDFERRVSEAERHVNGVYASTRQAAEALRRNLVEANGVIDALESASFQLYPDEAGFHACKAEWYVRGGQPVEGMLFLTDGRLLFEQRQEIVTKRVLFIKTEKKVQQELLWFAPIGGIEVVALEDKKELLRARKELLVLRLEGGNAPHEVTLNLMDARNEDWARYIKRAQEGQFDAERIDVALPATAEAAPSEAGTPVEASAVPTKCPSCGANLPTLYKGMRELRCAYCDTLIRL